jgi:hypothetical protein
MSHDPKFDYPERPVTHCLRPHRHRPHSDEVHAPGWHRRTVYCDGLPVVEGGSEAAEWCEDCGGRLLPNTRATTCLVHRLCLDCEPHRADFCADCYFEQGRYEVCS